MKGQILLAVLLLAPAAAPDIEGIGPAGPIRRLHTGFRFTEGPAADGKGNVYFSDVRSRRIHKVDAEGKLSVFREPTGRANGLMFNGKGELVACEGGTGSVVAIDMDNKRRVLADTYDGEPFNAPNDLVIDRNGGVYFTDPYFGPPKPLPQKTMGVYYVPAGGKAVRVVESLPWPNGVILSPDEKTLYVVCSRQEEVMAYPVTAPGKLGKGRAFCRLAQPPQKKGTGGDGLTVDVKGNLYITSRRGLQVFDAAGRALGIVEFPEMPANVTFGGEDRVTLFVTARTSLYAVRMKVKGHVFPAGR